MIVVDASIVLKCLVLEEGTDDAVALVQSEDCIAPDLLVHECVNALWKNVRTGKIIAGDAAEALEMLAALEIELAPSSDLAARTLELALSLEHPAYDCFYLALAEARGVELVVADDKFARKVLESRAPRARVTILTDRAI